MLGTLAKVNLQILDYGEGSDDEVICNNPNLMDKLIEKGRRLDFVCYNYALKDNQLSSCSEAYDLVITTYDNVPIKEMKTGDIIVYMDTDFYATHFAIVDKVGKCFQDTIVISKWGTLRVYKTYLEEIPKEYGKMIEVYRKRKEK